MAIQQSRLSERRNDGGRITSPALPARRVNERQGPVTSHYNLMIISRAGALLLSGNTNRQRMDVSVQTLVAAGRQFVPKPRNRDSHNKYPASFDLGMCSPDAKYNDLMR